MRKTGMWKKVGTVVLAAAMITGMSATSFAAETSATEETAEEVVTTEETQDTEAVDGSDVKVFIDLSLGGLGDEGFNDLSFKGIEDAAEQFGITYDYAEPKSYSECEAYVMDAATSEEYDLIIGIGYDNYSAVDAAAEAYPDQKFALLQSEMERDNVLCVKESLDQMGYLTGVYVGTMMSQDLLPAIEGNRSVGIIMGVDSDEAHSEVYGFMAGLYDVCKDEISVECTEVGAWDDSATGKELAQSLYEKGCGVIWHIAGTSGLGMFEVANETEDLYVLGSSGNQNALGKTVLCSAMDCMDTQVVNVVEDYIKGEYEAGTVYLGFDAGAITLAFDGSAVELPDDVKTTIDEIQAKLISGEIEPPYTEEEYNTYIAK